MAELLGTLVLYLLIAGASAGGGYLLCRRATGGP